MFGFLELAQRLDLLMVVLALRVPDALGNAKLSRFELTDGLGVSEAELIEALRNRSTSVIERHWVSMLVDWAKRLVDLHKRTVRQLLDDARFDTVLQNLTVGTCLLYTSDAADDSTEV